MKVEFSKKFYKDVDAIEPTHIRQSLIRLIESLEAAENLEAIGNLKRLKGHKSAYRIRINDYRLGFFFENATILLARFVHRKDIYKMFP